jgi:putative transposase
VFIKEINNGRGQNVTKVYGIDINENNVTIYCYPMNKAITIVTNFSKIILGYMYRRSRTQQRWSRILGVKDNRRLKVSLRRLRERNVKRGVKLKLTKTVISIVNDGLVVLEKLPKRFQDKLIERNGKLNGLDVHRLKQSSIRGIHRLIIEKLEEYGIPYVLVNPAHTSSTCPICGSKLTPMMGYAQRSGWRPRPMKCMRCGFVHDRDVIGAMNIVKKYLLDVGLVPSAPKGAHDPHVEWSVTTMKRRAEAQPVLARPTMT